MSDFIHGMPLQEAFSLIRDRISCVAGEQDVDLAEALGRIVVRTIIAPEALPLFARSTVDGYAVHSYDTFGAEEGAPALLSMAGEVLMGKPATNAVVSGSAVRISTGGMMPPGADAAVMVEHSEMANETEVLVWKRAAPGENVIQPGEDVACGQTVLAAGQCVTPADVGLLAACGIRRLAVRCRLRIGVISTGDELTEAESALRAGEVRDCNRPMLSAALKRLDAEVVDYGIVRDNAAALKTTLSRAVRECRMVLLSGGSSMGQRDYAAQTIDQLGQPGVVVHGLAIKPGRPTIVGFAGDVPIFGLPGHPAAAMTVFQLLVAPLIRRLRGESRKALPTVSALLTRNVPSVPGRDDFVSVKLLPCADGWRAEPILGRSGLVSVLAEADGMIHIPASVGGFYEGEPVQASLVGSDGLWHWRAGESE